VTGRRHQAAHGDEREKEKSESGKGASDVSEHAATLAEQAWPSSDGRV
jgi:hypothetical protein